MNYELFTDCTINGYQLKERTGATSKREHLPRWTVWNGDYLINEYRRKDLAKKWMRSIPKASAWTVNR